MCYKIMTVIFSAWGTKQAHRVPSSPPISHTTTKQDSFAHAGNSESENTHFSKVQSGSKEGFPLHQRRQFDCYLLLASLP